MAKRNLPTAPVVAQELWQQLYQAATDLQLLAPWQWMDDTHVLGINSPQGVRLVSVMGSLGEVFGLVSYRRNTGANFIIRLLRGEFPPETLDAVYYQDAVLVDFVPRNELRAGDRRIIQEIGFCPVNRKPRLFPKFSSFIPGYVPWFIDESEARLLLEDLQKALRFAQLVRAQPKPFKARESGQFPFYPERVSEPLSLGQFEWHLVSPVPPPADPPVTLDPTDLAALLQTHRMEDSAWELTAFYSKSSIGEPPRPYWPKLALSIDAPTGIVLGFQLGDPQQTMATVAAECLKKAVMACGGRPAAIRLDSVNLFRALGPVAKALKAKLLQVKSLPMAEEVRRSLEAYNSKL